MALALKQPMCGAEAVAHGSCPLVLPENDEHGRGSGHGKE